MAMVAVLLCHSGDMKNENIFVFSEKKSERERWSYDGSWYLSTYDELDTTATLSLFRLKPTVQSESENKFFAPARILNVRFGKYNMRNV